MEYCVGSHGERGRLFCSRLHPLAVIHPFPVACMMRMQVCVAYTDQVLPLWVHDSSLIAMRVVSVDAPGGVPTNEKGRSAGSSSATCVRLTAETEVAITPKPRTQRTSEGSRSEFPPFEAVTSLVRSGLPFTSSQKVNLLRDVLGRAE